jgi:hypothetical protein
MTRLEKSHSASPRSTANGQTFGKSANTSVHPSLAYQRVRAASLHKIDSGDIMALQRTIGNQAAGRMIQQERNYLQALHKRPVAARNEASLPDALKSGVESMSGFDMSDVRVHRNSDQPAQIGALAYTLGGDIYLAPGQERHLPHEAWHAVQQKQGRVRPTRQMKGIGVNDDVALEKEADETGKRAASEARVRPLRSARVPVWIRQLETALATVRAKKTPGYGPAAAIPPFVWERESAGERSSQHSAARVATAALEAAHEHLLSDGALRPLPPLKYPELRGTFALQRGRTLGQPLPPTIQRKPVQVRDNVYRDDTYKDVSLIKIHSALPVYEITNEGIYKGTILYYDSDEDKYFETKPPDYDEGEVFTISQVSSQSPEAKVLTEYDIGEEGMGVGFVEAKTRLKVSGLITCVGWLLHNEHAAYMAHIIVEDPDKVEANGDIGRQVSSLCETFTQKIGSAPTDLVIQLSAHPAYNRSERNWKRDWMLELVPPALSGKCDWRRGESELIHFVRPSHGTRQEWKGAPIKVSAPGFLMRPSPTRFPSSSSVAALPK